MQVWSRGGGTAFECGRTFFFVFNVGDIRFGDTLVLHLMWMRVENYDLTPVFDVKCSLTWLLDRFSMNKANCVVSITRSNTVVKPTIRVEQESLVFPPRLLFDHCKTYVQKGCLKCCQLSDTGWRVVVGRSFTLKLVPQHHTQADIKLTRPITKPIR